MKKWIVAIQLLVLSACSSTPKTTWYQLPGEQNIITPVSQRCVTGSQPVLWLEHITVPDYLAGNGIVYQSNEVRYVITENHLWATPLDQQLQQTLVTHLSRALPGRLVTAVPSEQPHDTLNVTVSHFHGRYDGRVVISGEWLLEHNSKLIKRPFTLVLPQQQDGYDALVKALALGWQQVAQQMADDLSCVG